MKIQTYKKKDPQTYPKEGSLVLIEIYNPTEASNHVLSLSTKPQWLWALYEDGIFKFAYEVSKDSILTYRVRPDANTDVTRLQGGECRWIDMNVIVDDININKDEQLIPIGTRVPIYYRGHNEPDWGVVERYIPMDEAKYGENVVIKMDSKGGYDDLYELASQYALLEYLEMLKS